MLYESPDDHVLLGIHTDSSGVTKDVAYLWVFCMPLYVPTGHVNFNYGKRLGGPTLFSLTDDGPAKILKAIRDEALPYLAEHKGLPKALKAFASRANGSTRALEATAYGNIMLGRFEPAAAQIETLLGAPMRVEWELEVRERAVEIQRLLRTDRAEAQEQLRTWEMTTKSALRLKP
jgi:hypothetical protein